MPRIDKHKIAIELINKMFEIAGHEASYKDVEGRTDEWYTEYTMTEEQNKEWKDWGTKFIKKQLRTTVKAASVEMAWFDVAYGLKIKK